MRSVSRGIVLHTRFLEVCVVGINKPVACRECMGRSHLLGTSLKALLSVLSLHGGKSEFIGVLVLSSLRSMMRVLPRLPRLVAPSPPVVEAELPTG